VRREISLIETNAAFNVANDLGYFGYTNVSVISQLTNKHSECGVRCRRIDI
jgi:hypothetical protein